MNEKELILCDLLNCDRPHLYLNGIDSCSLSTQERARYLSILEKRKEGLPLHYILGRCEFFGLEFKIRAGVFIPRPETEILVEKAIEKMKDEGRRTKDVRIFDIGTGSGNIAISLAKHLPNAKITAVDISPEAICLASENAQLHGVTDRIEFVNADIAAISYQLSAISYDIIVSNPPYIKSEDISGLQIEVQHEPIIALDGGKDGLDFYPKIMSIAAALLKPNGLLIFEIGLGQAEDIVAIIADYSQFSVEEIIKDHSAIERVMVLKKQD